MSSGSKVVKDILWYTVYMILLRLGIYAKTIESGIDSNIVSLGAGNMWFYKQEHSKTSYIPFFKIIYSKLWRQA